MSSLTRRQALTFTASSAAALGAQSLLGAASHAAAAAVRPHIVLIVSDEERHWSLTEALIPADRLATFQGLIAGRMELRNKGVRLNNYFTPTAPCSPARSVLYTGHHAVDNGVVDNMDFDTQTSLSPEVPTLADVLGQAGYYCAYKGKVHLARDEDLTTAQDMASRYGFQDWQGPFRTGDAEGPLSGTMRDDEVARYAQEWLASTGATLHGAGQPFLLAVNFINPHDIMMVDVDGRSGKFQIPQGPNPTSTQYDPNTTNAFPLSPIPSRKPYLYWWNPLKPGNGMGVSGYGVNNSGPRPGALDEWASMLSGGFGNITLSDTVTTSITVYQNNSRPDLGTQVITAPLWQVYLNYYLNCIIDNDASVRKVLNALKAQPGLLANTLVIFTSDHGELALSHMGASRYYKAARTSGYETPEQVAAQTPVVMPLRQKGAFVFQENNLLPMVVARLSTQSTSLAAKLLPTVGVDSPALASSVDLLPTLVSWAGQDASWYSQRFGSTLSQLGMLTRLPGVSLHKLLQDPARYTTPKWNDGQQGRNWVLFTADALSSALDADYAYLAIWGQCAGQSMNLSKRGCVRGLFDGQYKYARFFSPQDYAINGAAYANSSYATLVSQGSNGQDVQLFRHDLPGGSLETYNRAAASNAPVARLNSLLHSAMSAELRHITEAPATIQGVLNGEPVNACG